ncbi:MAG: hypothetical protein WCV79_02335 [Candidatus Paceibacterota bacterium]
MKNITLTSSVFVALVLLTTSIAHATVGGPTLIESIQYSPTDNQNIIFQSQNYGGKGCPEELYSMNNITGTKTGLVTCSDADWATPQAYNARLESVLAQYPNMLRRIHLINNNISGTIRIVSEQKIDQDKGFFGRTDFQMDVYQDGIKKGSATYSGCSAEQPHILEGYIIPNKSILFLLIATKGDCFEGGYTRETLHAIPNITLYDQAPLSAKGKDEAVNRAGNLRLVATRNADLEVTKTSPSPTTAKPAQTNTPNNNTPADTTSNIFLNYQIMTGALVLIILVLILKKK